MWRLVNRRHPFLCNGAVAMSTVVHISAQEELRILLDLADHSRDVATTTDYTGLAVVVPDDLYERYLTYQSLDSSPPVEPKKKEKP